MMFPKSLCIASIYLLVPADGFSVLPRAPVATMLEATRRDVVLAGLLATVPLEAHADTGAEVRGTKLNAFNGLAFQYRGSDFDGLSAADIDEESIPYTDFVDRLKSGDIKFVEFMAPDGDKAYATFQDGKRIRIGEGFPIEQHDGYSSPSFAIRTVKNAGVEYKFTVPALGKYRY